ncbi:heavy metal translocating P-type ATPase [Celerinatantimonas sp. MCCC 1A17872]|uniref:heavy metal translocating P-type ATPase n=1 Tax=Celerinatantimonas sp. MCCC 1A17872 TaxID=3177514 RepID=UPI0038C1A0D9
MSDSLTIPVEGMRCAGCSSRVEQTLNDLGVVKSASVNLALNQAHIELDDPNSLGEIVEALDKAGYPATTESSLVHIKGMRCAGCSAAVERALAKVPGVINAEVNYALGQANVTIVAGLGLDGTIKQAIENAGYEVEGDSSAVKPEAPKTSADFPWRLVVSIVLTIPLLVPMIFPIAALPGGWQWLLATPVEFIIGWPFIKGAWHALRNRSSSMDTLVTMGTFAAYGYSVWLHLSGHSQHLYFDGAAVIITLIVFGRYLESRAKARAAKAVSELINEAPMQAHRIDGDNSVDVSVDSLKAGDWLLIKPGEKVPADGIVRWGSSAFNEALITGESEPVAHPQGDTVLAGSLNGEGLVKIEVTRANEDSTLGRMIQMVSDAQAGKAPVQKLADKISFYFVPIVLSIAVVSFLVWGLAFSDWANGAIAAISVLVIACPCSLGLAIPTALVAGTGSGARYGILYRNIDALEKTRQIDQVIFDKTGTLTVGEPKLHAVDCEGSQELLLQLVASAQQGSQHPLAKAMLAANEQPLIELEHFDSYPGMGISATLDNDAKTNVLIGNQALLEKFEIALDESWQKRMAAMDMSGSSVYVAIDGKLHGIIATADPVREDAAAAIAKLQRSGVTSVMLTGDQQRVADALAHQLGLSDWQGELKPQDKLNEVKTRQQQGHHVLMVGDGVNDAPALAQADVGIAMGSGSDLAIESADVALMRDEPMLVADAVHLARQTWRIIQQNLFWAFGYNVIGIPLAAFGLLNPAIAGAAMALSSVSVVTNSVRLTRWRPSKH